MQSNPKKKIWYEEQVNILKRWGEQSSCYRYMHYRAYEKYKKSSMRFTLPIIIISTLTGTANFAQETFPESWKSFVPVGIGGMNLIAAIMTTILQFLKINELMESHRVSSVHYGKLSRSIRLQLTLPPLERSHNGSEFVDFCNQEYDRLIEQSPPVPNSILRRFEKEFPEMMDKSEEEDERSCIMKFLCCCANDIDEKDPDLNLERPEIIKLTVIKPYEYTKKRTVSSQVSGTSTPIVRSTPKGISALKNLFSPRFNTNRTLPHISTSTKPEQTFSQLEPVPEQTLRHPDSTPVPEQTLRHPDSTPVPEQSLRRTDPTPVPEQNYTQDEEVAVGVLSSGFSDTTLVIEEADDTDEEVLSVKERIASMEQDRRYPPV